MSYEADAGLASDTPQKYRGCKGRDSSGFIPEPSYSYTVAGPIFTLPCSVGGPRSASGQRVRPESSPRSRGTWDFSIQALKRGVRTDMLPVR